MTQNMQEELMKRFMEKKEICQRATNREQARKELEKYDNDKMKIDRINGIDTIVTIRGEIREITNYKYDHDKPEDDLIVFLFDPEFKVLVYKDNIPNIIYESYSKLKVGEWIRVSGKLVESNWVPTEHYMLAINKYCSWKHSEKNAENHVHDQSKKLSF